MAPHDSDNGNGGAAPSSDDPTSLVEELRSQAEKLKNDHLYLRAEFDTFRRNAAKERSDLVKYGCERLLVEILGVIDNFERALSTKATPENLQSFVKGVEMTAQELKSVLSKFGVSEGDAKIGNPFDPTLHEALGAESSSSMAPGAIVRVLRKPYKLHDKLVRPAQVVVAKTPEKPAGE